MNTISIFLYVISVVMWWTGFNYSATRTESPTRRKLLSTAAAFALAWPAAFIALAGALATKAAANLMIAVGNGINNTWDAAVRDEGDDTIVVTKLIPMGAAVRVRRENTEHDTSAANSGYEDSDIETTTGEEVHPALADNMPLMPPPPPPATNETEHDAPTLGNTGDNAETTETADNNDSADDETVTIQKVTLADMI